MTGELVSILKNLKDRWSTQWSSSFTETTTLRAFEQSWHARYQSLSMCVLTHANPYTLFGTAIRHWVGLLSWSSPVSSCLYLHEYILTLDRATYGPDRSMHGQGMIWSKIKWFVVWCSSLDHYMHIVAVCGQINSPTSQQEKNWHFEPH
jgi:hypothetical protein